MTAALPTSLACWLIDLYQRYVSPRKGFCCAYRLRHRRRDSCSQYAKRAIGKLGLLPGVRLLGRRFDKCGRAAKVLDYETPQRKEEQRRKKDSCLNHADCTPDCGSGCDPSGVTDGCDLVTSVAGGSCDAGGCDLSV